MIESVNPESLHDSKGNGDYVIELRSKETGEVVDEVERFHEVTEFDSSSVEAYLIEPRNVFDRIKSKLGGVN